MQASSFIRIAIGLFCIALILLLNLSMQSSALSQTVHTVKRASISLQCDEEQVEHLYSLPRIPPPNLKWEQQIKSYQNSIIMKQDNSGLAFPSDFTSTNVLPPLHGDGFILDKNRYALVLPDLDGKPCAIEFNSSSLPVWVDRTCVTFAEFPPRTDKIDVEKCPEGSAIVNYLQFMMSKISGYAYFPSTVYRNDYDLDELDLVYYNVFADGCRTQNLIKPGLVGQDRKKQQFVSLMFEDFDGSTIVLFSDECIVSAAKE